LLITLLYTQAVLIAGWAWVYILLKTKNPAKAGFFNYLADYSATIVTYLRFKGPFCSN